MIGTKTLKPEEKTYWNIISISENKFMKMLKKKE